MIVPTRKKFRMGDALVEAGLISNEQLQQALAGQRSTGQMLGEVLVDQGAITPKELVDALSRLLGIHGCVLREGLFDPTLFNLISPEDATRLKVVPMFRVHNRLTVAMAEPQSLPTIDRLRQMTGCRIKPVLALERNIVEAITLAGESSTGHQVGTELPDHDGPSSNTPPPVDESVIDLDQAQGEDNAVVKLVNRVLATAIRQRASDIHIEPSKIGTRMRVRVDGVLREFSQPPAGMHPAIVSRVKVIGRMDIAEKRLPQEGRVRLLSSGREIDLRVSSMPTLLGEKLVLRILDKSNLNVQMEQLGFRDEALVTFKRILSQPYGLVLVTGPTGSGKTTTLYSALDLLRSPESNIITVEDPVEYQLDLINQVQVQDSIGMSFARALRSILRQDPDIIMVGEIRDEETARVAVQAALTGHLVLATLHTNDAPGAVARLLDMNIEPYLLSGAINGVVAQRLARKTCSQCVADYDPDPSLLADAGFDDTVGVVFRRGIGCQRCHNVGYQGRVGIYEVMEVTSPIRKLIHQAVPSHALREAMQEQGALTLREEGKLIVARGQTSVEELLRVTHSQGHTEDEDPDS